MGPKTVTLALRAEQCQWLKTAAITNQRQIWGTFMKLQNSPPRKDLVRLHRFLRQLGTPMSSQNEHSWLILSHHHAHGEVFAFEPSSLSFRVMPESVSPATVANVSGIASLKEGGFSAFYKYDSSLWVCFDTRRYSVTNALKSRWNMGEWTPRDHPRQRGLFAVLKATPALFSERVFELIQDSCVVERRNYVIEEPDPDIRPFVFWGEDLEDFLLWMHDTLHSDERKGLLMQIWK